MTAGPPILASRDRAEELPTEPNHPTDPLLRHGSMELRWYAPKGHDAQPAHDRDEIYVVITGKGWFVSGDRRVAFGPSDALFVPAHQTHRFEDFTPDLAVWVILYGPTGGEARM